MNEQHLALLKQGVEAWNRWRQENPEIRPDLSGVRLKGARFFGANLNGADLFKASLIEAYLIEADLRETNLREANLNGARFCRADLFMANLSGADLRGADLREANLIGAKLIGVNLVKANLSWANLSRADISRANLSGANLSEASLVHTKLEHAELTGCSVHGASVWGVNLTGAKQKDLIITREGEPVVMVDDLEVAQFVYLLLHHDKLRNVLNAVTERGVLLLGRFSEGGLETLKAMGERLRELGYTPIIFDFERPTGYDYTETVKTLVGLSRFVIVDLSGPSVAKELEATVPDFERPFGLIIEKKREPFFLARDLAKYPWVLQPVVEFEDGDELLDLLPERLVNPAEAYIGARQRQLDDRDPRLE